MVLGHRVHHFSESEGGFAVPLEHSVIDQCFEAVLLAAVKEPVDGAFLVGLAVVGIEVVQEVAADDLAGRSLAAERISNEFEVFFQRIATVDCLHPLHKASGDVVVKVVVVADGDDVILIRD